MIINDTIISLDLAHIVRIPSPLISPETLVFQLLTQAAMPQVLVADLFTRLEYLMRPQFQATTVDLHTEIETEGIQLTANPALIEQVLLNLLLNAIEAMADQDGGLGVLSASLDSSGRVELHVRDNGPGIEAEALDKIYIPFFTTKAEGSGIGLSLARQVMRSHHGTIRVRSPPGLETVFTLTF